MSEKNTSGVEYILGEIDRLIAERMALRDQVAELANQQPKPYRPARDAEYFGMWADREDMKGKSSREWLEELRSQQWRPT